MNFTFTDIEYRGYSLQPLEILETNLITRLIYGTRLNARVAMRSSVTLRHVSLVTTKYYSRNFLQRLYNCNLKIKSVNHTINNKKVCRSDELFKVIEEVKCEFC